MVAQASPASHLGDHRRTAMLYNTLQTTLAFAPAPEDLEEVFFDIPVVTFAPFPGDDEESEQGEP
jgi:hypothetical protein